MTVSKDDIVTLRERTGAGIMDARRALEQADGNMDKAAELLREKGLATAAKKAGREANQGLIESYVHGHRLGALIELNCETDFVARTDDFRNLAREIAMQVAANGADNVDDLKQQPYIRDSSKTVQDLISDTVAKVGENVVLRRFCRFELGGE